MLKLAASKTGAGLLSFWYRNMVISTIYQQGGDPMMTQQQLLEACKAKTHKGSWYAVAKALQVDQTRLVHYRKNGIYLSDAVCVQVADFLGLPRDYVLVCIAAEKAGDTASGNALRALADLIEGAQRAA